MMTTIIFEAHATSLDKGTGLASGWNDVALSELGERQARELGVRYAGDKFDAAGITICYELETPSLPWKCSTTELGR